MPVETLEAVAGFNLRSGTAAAFSQSSRQQGLGCSRPLVTDGVIHVVFNEHVASGGVRNHFIKARLDFSSEDGGACTTGGAWSWWSSGTRPVRAIQGVDDQCSTLIYAKGGLFCFATGPQEGGGGGGASGSGGLTGTAFVTGGGPSAEKSIAWREGGGGLKGSGGDGVSNSGSGGAVFESLSVHSGGIVDFRVNPFSRDIVSGCDHGHVHVLNFAPDMMGVPTMKASKYVAQPLSSVRWGMRDPHVASWTSSRGLLQLLDTRAFRVASSIQVEGPFPVHTHEYLSDVVLAVGCASGCLQLFDIRMMKTFVSLQDPVAGSIHQILPFVGGGDSGAAASESSSPHLSGASSDVKDWVALGSTGMSRYTVGGNSHGASITDQGDLLAGVAAGLSYAAGCRTSDLKLSAGLDFGAGLFLAPVTSAPGHSGTTRRNQNQNQQVCGISLDSRIVTFSAPATPGGGGDGGDGGGGDGGGGDGDGGGLRSASAIGNRSGSNCASKGMATTMTPAKGAISTTDVEVETGLRPSLRTLSPVAPAHGTRVTGCGGAGACAGGRTFDGASSDGGLSKGLIATNAADGKKGASREEAGGSIRSVRRKY